MLTKRIAASGNETVIVFEIIRRLHCFTWYYHGRVFFFNKKWTIISACKDDIFVPRARRFFCSRSLSLKIRPRVSKKGKGTDDGFQRVTAILSMHQHDRPATNNLLVAQDTQDVRPP